MQVLATAASGQGPERIPADDGAAGLDELAGSFAALASAPFGAAPALRACGSLEHVDHLLARVRRADEGLGGRDLLHLLFAHLLPGATMAHDLSGALCARFGGLGGVLAAPWNRLEGPAGALPGLVSLLKTMHAIVVAVLREPLLERTILDSMSALLDYLRVSLAHNGQEQVRLLFLDTKNALIADEKHSIGTIDHAPLYPREVVRRVLELDAKALILVHNHPSGDPTPSPADIAMTRQLSDVLSQIGVSFHDHLIIGHNRHTSFRQSKLI